jgi:glyceraldehyde-3-phosphate dehydrogenase/erythrose-4-phosphate dehydrogenase
MSKPVVVLGYGAVGRAVTSQVVMRGTNEVPKASDGSDLDVLEGMARLHRPWCTIQPA